MNWARAGLLALALGLGGCPADELQGGRYACTFGGPADQCPGSWRCGHENVCHAVGDEQPWICTSDAHCEGAWTCGLAPNRDGGECHDPATGAPHACTTSAQCTGGWHCGPGLTCYDRAVKAPVACRADGGDCADGWRCGLDGKCQDTAVGAPHPCAEADGGLNDGWCEAGWRCAPEGKCTDPSQDALGSGVKAFGPADRIHPARLDPPFERFSLSPTFDTGLGAGRQTLVFVTDGGLAAHVIDARTQSKITAFDLGRFEGGHFVAMGNRGKGWPSYAVDDTSRVYQALPDGGGRLHRLFADGTHDLYGDPFGFGATRLVIGTGLPTLPPRVLAYTPAHPFRFDLAEGDSPLTSSYQFVTDEPNEPWTFPGNRIVDVATSHVADRLDCVFAVDTRGLWAAQKGFVGTPASNITTDFEAVQVGPITNDFCAPPTPSTQRITGLTALGRDWLAATTVPIDGGTTSVSLIDLRNLWIQPTSFAFCTTLAGGPCDPATRIPIEIRTGPCPVCAGGTVADFAIVGDEAKPHIDVRCAGSDGGTIGFVSIGSETIGAGCLPSFPQGQNGLLSHPSLRNGEARVGGQVAWVSGIGPWVWSGTSAAGARSDLFDRPAAVVARRGATLSDLVAFESQDYASHVADAGFVSRAGIRVVAGVPGAPTWVVTSDRAVLELTGSGPIAASPLIGIAGNAVTPFEAPFHAAFARQGNGAARVLVVTAGASVFAAEMDAVLSGQTLLAAVGLRAVAPGPIGSLAFPATSAAEVYLRGYAVTPNGVLRVTAQTATRWDFTPVPLPSALVPREVWFEGTRGRVGFGDGTVFALPSRVPIAPPLGDVVDFAQACGQQLALTVAGLHRLEPVPGSGIGKWSPIALPDGFVERGLANGRVHGLADAVYVFANAGETGRVVFEGCP